MEFQIFGIFIIILIFPIVVYAAGCGTKTIGGTNLGPTYTSIDTTTGRGYLANAYRVDCCGVLTAWNVDIRELGTIHLQVWRPSGSQYTLVTSNTYTFSANDQIKVHTLAVDTALQATIKPDDVIGWYATGQEMVPYKSGLGNYVKKNPGSNTSPIDFSGGTTLAGREYGINIVTGNNVVPRFTNLPAKLSFLDTKSVGGVTLFQLTSTDNNKDDTVLDSQMTTTDTKFILDLQKRVKIQQQFWEVGEFILDYTVTDQCDNIGYSSLTISVNNTNPDIKNTAQSIEVREHINDETRILQLTVTDKQTFTCTKSSISPDDDSFIVKQGSASSAYGIYLLSGKAHPSVLDYETKPQYQITVSCTDDLGLTTEKMFFINVIKNEPPTITGLPTEVSKSTRTTTTGSQIYQVTATDPENDALEYTMTCSPATCPFSIEKSTGKITSTQDLSLHKISPYTVSVSVYDGHRTTGPTTLTVKLTDINIVPVISNLGTSSLTRTVDENSAVGTEVYDVDVNDGNTGETHTFSALYTTSACANMYTIDTNSGKVTTLTGLDYENLYTTGLVTCDLVITVNDGREDSTSRRLRIQVNDLNEQQTGFRETTYFILADEGQPGKELQDPGFIVDDEDRSDVQSYSMDCGTRQSYFNIDPTTGLITQTLEYDLDADNRKFNIAKCKVTATDKGGNTVQTNLEIRVEEINDNPPVLNKNKYDFVVPQNAPVGNTQLGVCNTTDADVHDEFKDHAYSIDGSILRVGNTCQMKLTADISGYPVGTLFEMTLTATDVGGLTDTARVCVTIIDPTTSSMVTQPNNNNNNNNNGGTGGTGTGNSGSPAEFLEDPIDLAWIIPGALALAVLTGLIGYMIFRCCRHPGFCSNACRCCRNNDCCTRGSKRGSAKISEANEAKKKKASSDKADPKSKGKPAKPIKIRDPERYDGKYEWNIWNASDFSNANHHNIHGNWYPTYSHSTPVTTKERVEYR